MDSIDVFDTALFRDVYEPKDIFTLIEHNVYNNFRTRRIEAEKKASSINRFYSLKDIYRFLIGFNPQIEIDMEMNHVYANPKILDMYNKNPKNYIFISDMYLSSDTIKKLLEKCGYKNPTVMVSCEEKCNKGSGVLFEKAIRRFGKISKHYGDNYRSDIEGCIKQGIEPVFEQALHCRKLNLPAVKNPLLKKYVACLEASNESALSKMAKYYAPLLYGFTDWVLEKGKGKQIYFLSRDMFMPYIISKHILKQDNVHYLYCSRRSLAPLFIKSGEKPLLDKMRIVLSDKEYKEKTDTVECMKYLKSTGIKNGDVLVDIGYSGSTQRVLEKFLNIRLKGLYIQLDKVNPVHNGMDMEMYLKRFALTYRFLAEFIFTSPEDCIEDYKDGRVLTTPDHEKRKEYAKQINQILVNETLYNRIKCMNLDITDIEQMLIHIQQYPSYEMMELFNEPILTNRQRMERGINFDKERILKGELQECYRKSYAKPLFKRMLELDEDLNSLSKLIP